MRNDLLVVLILVLAGCLGGKDGGNVPRDSGTRLGPDFSGLEMGHFALVAAEPGVASWIWQDEVPAPGATGVLESSFSLPSGLDLQLYMWWSADVNPRVIEISPVVMDEGGEARCFPQPTSAERGCLLYLEALAEPVTWTARIRNAWPHDGIGFALELELRAAPAPLFEGRPLDESGPAFGGTAFRVWTTGIKAMGTPEPSLGATSSGTLLTPSDGSSVLRSRDDGRTWQRIATPSLSLDADPWLWVDPETDRVFRIGLHFPGCAQLVTSDDDGDAWTDRGVAACGPPNHYEKLTTGPPPPGVSTNGYPNIVYYVASLLADYLLEGSVVGDTAGVWVSTSLDGGATWGVGTLVHPGRQACEGWGGPIVVTPDGTAFSSAQYCDGVRIARSTDGGATWQQDGYLRDAGHFSEVHGPSVAVDSAGRLFLVYTAANGHAVMHVRESTGAWSDAVEVTPPNINATAFTIAHAVAPGVVVVAFAGTSSNPESWPEATATAAPDATVWHMHAVIVSVENGVVARTAFQLTPPEDPLQRGCIDRHGSQTSDCRNLGDFIGIAALDGRPYITFTDGCIRCTDAATSRDGLHATAVLEGLLPWA